MFKDLKGKIVVITGARRGMGKSHAIKFAEMGSKVVVSDISKKGCEEVVKEIKEKGGEAISVKCDVTKKEEVDRMFDEAVDRFGGIDILVNNAGIAEFKSFLDLTEEEWDKTIEVNLKGYFLCARRAAKEMKKRGGGSIVNIASVAMGQVGIGYPTLVHYTSSKGGVVGMTEALAAELAKENIRVNSISPGAIKTPMSKTTEEDKKATEKTLSRIPMGRIGEPEEVSNAVVFLSSDASSYTTGANLVIDGGWLSF